MSDFDQTSSLDYVRDGEPVGASEVNRPTAELAQIVALLQARVAAAQAGTTLYARDRSISAAAGIGSPVYFDAVAQQFKPALSAVTLVDGILRVADSSDIWGVVAHKTNATLGDVLLYGFEKMDLSTAVEPGTVIAPGVYYLSATAAGKLTRRRPPVPIPVLRYDGQNVMVNPLWRDTVTDHTHLRFDLLPMPAGSHAVLNNPNNPHVIFYADATKEGWLPANHASFNGKAPAMAKFGYNIAANPALRDAWPPLPPENAVLEMNGIVCATGINGQVVFDRNGIWWMTSCINQVPWPNKDFDIADIGEAQESLTHPEYDGNPCYKSLKRLSLSFLKFTYFTDAVAVTSLTSDDPRLQVVCDTDPSTVASTGPLRLKLDLQFTIDPDPVRGYTALKSFDPDTQTFSGGPVASGVYAKSGNVQLAGSASEVVTIGSTPYTVYRGDIGISVISADSRELYVSDIRVDGVKEAYDSNTMYLGFENNKTSSLRGRIRVPENLDVTSPVMAVRVRILSKGAGTLPNLTLSVRRIPKSVGAIAVLPTTDTTVSLVSTFTAVGVDRYRDFASSSFAVAAGDDVLFTLTRTAGDAYNYPVGLMRVAGLIASGA